VRLTSPVVASQPACVNDAVFELEIAYSSHGCEESSKDGGAHIDAVYAEPLDWVPPSSTTVDQLLDRSTIDMNVLPQRSLRERRPVATDERGVEVEVSSRYLFSDDVRFDWMGDSDDVLEGLERQVVDGGHGRGGGVEVDGEVLATLVSTLKGGMRQYTRNLTHVRRSDPYPLPRRLLSSPPHLPSNARNHSMPFDSQTHCVSGCEPAVVP
jgi:hypothetical protein